MLFASPITTLPTYV